MSQMALELIARAKAEGWRRLDLGNCGIVGAVPEEVGELDQLEELIIRNSYVSGKSGVNLTNPKPQKNRERNKIDKLPQKLPIGLKSLIASHTNITELDSIQELYLLEILDLERTQVSNLKPISKLRNLRELNLKGTIIDTVEDLSSSAKLISLELSFTKINDISPLARTSSLEVLAISSTQICSIEVLGTLPKIKELRLSWTQIEDFSPVLALKDLRQFTVSGTMFSNLRLLSKSTKLELLDIEGTRVYDLSLISSFKMLKSLSLPASRVKSFSILSSLTNLQYLKLHHSMYATSRSASLIFSNLRQLKYLDLEQCWLHDLSPFRFLDHLKFLSIRNCPISDLSPIRTLIEKGLTIDFRGTRLENPPIEIAKKGNEAIVSYWREQDRVGILPAKELKLFLLGNTTAGKSTLSHALRNKEYLKESSSTEGANLSQTWQTDDINVNIWDFGGQEYFHATHQILMNDDAVYIVLADPKFNQSGYHKTGIRYKGETQSFEEEVEHFPHGYWLQMIKQHADRSGAIVVWNKLDKENCPPFGLGDPDKALFENNIKEYECSLKGAFLDNDSAWQNKWKVFLDDLHHKISEQLKGKQVIQYWPSVRELIEERSKTDIRISWEEFEALCKADDPLRELGNIVVYLRDMCGAILYFPDHPKLNKTVFINPNKINELIYAVLNRQVKNAGGRFTWDHAKERVRAALTAMDESEADAFAAELIAVMEEFKIIFEVSKGSEEYVSPQYLPKEEPASLKKEIRRAKLEPAFRLRFKSFVPRHIIPRFIAEKGLFAKDETWWKFGILYEETTEATALVQVDYPSQTISVSIHEPKKHQLELLEVFQLFKELIGNDQAFELSLDGQNFVAYEKLKEAIETKATLVKTFDGTLLNVKQFSLFDTTAFSAHHSFPIKHENPTSMKRIYISYAKEDRTDLDDLEKRLKVFQKMGQFSSWSRKHILPGSRTLDVIEAELAKADVIIMLVSAEYINVEEEVRFEYEQALRLGDEGKCLIVPVLLKAYHGWKRLPFGIYPAALEGRPFDQESNKDQAWSEIMEWIEKVLEARKEIVAHSNRLASATENRDLLIKIAADVDQIIESQIRIEGGIGILLELSKEQRDDIRNVQSFVEQNMFTEDQMLDAIQVIEDLVAVHIDDLEADVKEEFAKLKSKDLEIKKRLKMTIPIIPFVLRYELDMTDNSKDKKGRSLWKDMKNGKILF